MMHFVLLGWMFIDLTHTLGPNAPTWDGSCGYESSITLDYDQCKGEDKFRVRNIFFKKASAGTHIDAPSHCIQGGRDVAELPLEDLIVPCVVIDISDKAHERYSLTVADIEQFEKQYGTIEQGACVIVHTGWSKFWEDKDRYRNNLLFPSISKEAARVLVDRKIVGCGIDTMSPDREEDGFPVHKIFLEKGIYILENVANADQLQPTGCCIIALPLKGESLTEAPTRLVGLKSAR